MSKDRYTKTILTIIAASLLWISVLLMSSHDFIRPASAQVTAGKPIPVVMVGVASNSIVPVNLVSVPSANQPMPVNIISVASGNGVIPVDLISVGGGHNPLPVVIVQGN